MSLRRIVLVGLAVLLLALFLADSNSVEARRRRRSRRNQLERDDTDGGEAHSMFVLQWPESLCASEKRQCIGPIQPFLTIHGLWPIARHSAHCRSDFDPRQLAPIERNLSLVWPSYFKRKTSMSFWDHEYSKHGSCLYATIEEYFDVVLRLHRQYAAPLLAAIKPSNRPRPLRHFTQALHSAFGVEPMVMCQTQWVPRRRRSRFSSAEYLLEEGEVGDDDGEEIFEATTSELVIDAAGYEADVESADDDTQLHEQQLLVEVGLCFARPDDSSVPLRLVDCPAKGRVRRCRRDRDILFPRRGTFTSTHDAWSAQSSDQHRIHGELR